MSDTYVCSVLPQNRIPQAISKSHIFVCIFLSHFYKVISLVSLPLSFWTLICVFMLHCYYTSSPYFDIFSLVIHQEIIAHLPPFSTSLAYLNFSNHFVYQLQQLRLLDCWFSKIFSAKVFINIRTLCEYVPISALVGTITDSAQTKVHLCSKVTSQFSFLYCFCWWNGCESHFQDICCSGYDFSVCLNVLKMSVLMFLVSFMSLTVCCVYSLLV